MVKIGFEKLSPDAEIPSKAHPGDAGMDVCAIEDVELRPFVPTLARTGLKADIPDGYEIQVRPRSGLALKQGITVWNAPGTIDAGYKGEIGVIILWAPNVGYGTHESADYKLIAKGVRIAQLVVSPVVPCEAVEVDNVGTSERGSGGFGSTGMK